MSLEARNRNEAGADPLLDNQEIVENCTDLESHRNLISKSLEKCFSETFSRYCTQSLLTESDVVFAIGGFLQRIFPDYSIHYNLFLAIAYRKFYPDISIWYKGNVLSIIEVKEKKQIKKKHVMSERERCDAYERFFSDRGGVRTHAMFFSQRAPQFSVDTTSQWAWLACVESDIVTRGDGIKQWLERFRQKSKIR